MTARTYYTHEAEVRAQRDRTALAFIAVLLGVSIGSVLALLFAPQAGRKIRQQLGEQAEQVGTQVMDRTTPVRDFVAEHVNHH